MAPITPLRLKVEINTREHFAVFGYLPKKFSVKSPWFNGETQITTYSVEELLSAKLRALYQRKQGRDLFDIAIAFERIRAVNADRIVTAFLKYMEHEHSAISRAQFEANLSEKLADPVFTEDISPLFILGQHPTPALEPKHAAQTVMQKLIALPPRELWKGAK